MGIDIKIEGVDQVMKSLERLGKNAKDLDGTHEIAIDELMTPSFMRENSQFMCFSELVKSSGLTTGSGQVTAEEFKAIPNSDWDEWIRKATHFPDWASMIRAASEEYISRHIVEGIGRL